MPTGNLAPTRASYSFSRINLVKPKSAILIEHELDTKIFLAAKSLCIYCRSSRYDIPLKLCEVLKDLYQSDLEICVAISTRNGIFELRPLPCKKCNKFSCINSVIIKMGSSFVHTAYSCNSFGCLSLFIIWASARKSLTSAVLGFKRFTATGVVPFQRPSNTSPNCPLPIWQISLTERRSISHWSSNVNVLVWGISIREGGFPRVTQSPSASFA